MAVKYTRFCFDDRRRKGIKWLIYGCEKVDFKPLEKIGFFYKNLLDSSSLFLHSMIKCGCNVANNFRLKKENGD